MCNKLHPQKVQIKGVQHGVKEAFGKRRRMEELCGQMEAKPWNEIVQEVLLHFRTHCTSLHREAAAVQSSLCLSISLLHEM